MITYDDVLREVKNVIYEKYHSIIPDFGVNLSFLHDMNHAERLALEVMLQLKKDNICLKCFKTKRNL